MEDGEQVASYVDEDGVDPTRGTETFAQVAVQIDNWRRSGVPLTLRSGNALPGRGRGGLARDAARAVWLMVPAAITDRVTWTVAAQLSAGDVTLDRAADPQRQRPGTPGFGLRDDRVIEPARRPPSDRGADRLPVRDA